MSCHLGFVLDDSFSSIIGLMSGSADWSSLTFSSLHGSGSVDVEDVTCRILGFANPYLASALEQWLQCAGQGKDPFSSWSIPPTGKNCSKFDDDNLLNFKSPLETACNRKLNFICEHDPVTCGMPERPANSSIIMGSAVGSDIEYHCQPGHLLQGPPKIACLGTGYFWGAAPKCLYIECDFPASIPNGGYTLVNGTKYYQSIVQYFCQESYVLVGQSELMCDAERKWNGSLPRCDPILCHNPPRISHGNARVIVNIGVPYTIAEYTCEAAYTLIGEKRISCDSTGFWTSKPPICLGKKKIKIC
ncbi:E-selectin-like [Stegodyphus dumicola]|uniref:E-selectin-like n=1 Tax=Stegodyphus dumicola TaxID=202533 RepID=UPI0015AF047A|nr:E-selectin-like [Stegodyphus dumicola]